MTGVGPLRRGTVRRYAGGWAVVSGAARAEGLGNAFARQIAADGVNLVLIDIAGDELRDRARELRDEFGVEVRTAAADLGARGAWPAVVDATADVEVDLLVCNHMFTPEDTPTILDMDLDVHHRMLDVNARGYTTLVHTFGRAMRARRRGSIVIVSSGAGLTSAPYTAAYAANKAFQIALGEALWFEEAGPGVDVIVVAAGLMRTRGTDLDRYPQWMIAEPRDVARRVLDALGRKHLIMPSLPTKLYLLVQTRLSSRRRTLRSMGRFMERGLGK